MLLAFKTAIIDGAFGAIGSEGARALFKLWTLR
jgi:hypothetical protein